VAVSLEERWADYATAHARLHLPDGSTVEAGPVAGVANEGTFGDELGRTIHVITADNPGRDVSPDVNKAAHRKLLERAAELQWTYVHAHGGDPAWTHVEACIAVIGADLAEVLRVGLEFDQDAIFEWTPQQWSLVMCDGSMRADYAWRAWTVDPRAGGPLSVREVS
jgi:hypothetical protein